ncbi:MAG: arsenate reductase ArsC [Myxococcota bacterium]|jgi:arsenate reductase|nr:arsenate reductase ArsC [Myxococcota bacterium]
MAAAQDRNQRRNAVDAPPETTTGESKRDAVLFLCVANSARSQMAEGLARRLAPAPVGIYSAGSEPGELNPLAVEVMAEVGIDISEHQSKATDDIPLERVARVVTLCNDEVCPVVPGEVQVLHWPLRDPAGVTGSDRERLEAFRATRNAIEARLKGVFVEWSDDPAALD